MNRATCVLSLGFLSVVATARAGTLDNDPNVYVQDGTPWRGSSVFSSDGFDGYVDWAVYDSNHAPAGLTGFSRTPNEFLYAYQFFNTGGGPFSLIEVDLVYGESNFGTFTATGITGQPIIDLVTVPGFAAWNFPAIVPGDSTIGVVYSSPVQPGRGRVGVIDGHFPDALKQGIEVFGVGMPAIPEPSGIALAAFGFVGLMAYGWRRRKR
jgi:hypothetical protein